VTVVILWQICDMHYNDPQQFTATSGERCPGLYPIARRLSAPLLLCSSAPLLLCSSAPSSAPLLLCSSAPLLLCSSAPLLLCSSAPLLRLYRHQAYAPPLMRLLTGTIRSFL